MSNAEFPGQLLTESRESRGLSLMDVHHRIRVPLEHLRALEAGQLSKLPERTYVVGYLHSYCDLLEIDVELFLDRYHSCASQRTGGQLLPASAPRGGQPRWLGEAAAWSAICALLVLGWFAYSVVVRPWAENSRPPVEAGTMDVVPPTHFEDDF